MNRKPKATSRSSGQRIGDCEPENVIGCRIAQHDPGDKKREKHRQGQIATSMAARLPGRRKRLAPRNGSVAGACGLEAGLQTGFRKSRSGRRE